MEFNCEYILITLEANCFLRCIFKCVIDLRCIFTAALSFGRSSDGCRYNIYTGIYSVEFCYVVFDPCGTQRDNDNRLLGSVIDNSLSTSI